MSTRMCQVARCLVAWGVVSLSAAQAFAQDDLPCPDVDPAPPGALSDSLLRIRTGGERVPSPGFGAEPHSTRTTFHSRIRLRFDYKSYPDYDERSSRRYTTTQLSTSEPSYDPCGGQLDINPSWQVRLEADVLSGVLAGGLAPDIEQRAQAGAQLRRRSFDASTPGAAWEPRVASIGYFTKLGLIQLGLQTNDFGLGMVANSGDEAGENLIFDRRQGGDRVLRALFVTTPLQSMGGGYEHVYVALGADMVWEDDNASWTFGDRAYQAVGSVFYDRDDVFAGVYVASRRQRDVEGTMFQVNAVDASFKIPTFPNHDTLSGEVAAEVAILNGSTDRVYPFEGGDSTEINAAGVALEFRGYHTPTRLGSRVLAGGASGDSNLDDGTLYRFRFDPNYKVGLIMFDHYLPAVTREFKARASDLSQLGQRPRGIENVVNDGAIENAYYVNPQLTLGDPVQGAMIGAGAVMAWSPQPWSDPYSSAEMGGEPTGVRGATAQLERLGWEADFAAQYKTFLQDGRLSLALRAEGGVLLPGPAFATIAGDRPGRETLVRARLDFEW